MRQCLIDFGVFFFTALTDSQGWTPTSSEGIVSSCLCGGYKARGLEGENTRRKCFLMITAGQLMPGTIGHSGGLLNLFLIIAQSPAP